MAQWCDEEFRNYKAQVPTKLQYINNKEVTKTSISQLLQTGLRLSVAVTYVCMPNSVVDRSKGAKFLYFPATQAIT